MADNQYDSYDLETGEFIPAAPTPQSRFDDFSSALKNYGTSAGLGVADSLWNTGKSVGNLVLDPLSNITGRDLRLPRSEISNQLMPQGGSETARDIGDFAGNFLPIGLGLKAFSKAPQMLNNVAGASLAALLGGYATGEDFPIGGRKGAALLSASLAAPAKKISQYTDASIGKKIVQDAKALQKSFNKRYSSIWKEAEKKGVKEVKNPLTKEQTNQLKNSSSNRLNKSVERFSANPSLENAHKLQSDVGKYFNKNKEKSLTLSTDRDAVKAAEIARDTLKQSIYDSLQKASISLRGRYQQVGSDYKDKMVPYLSNKPISDAMKKPGQKGYINSARLPSELQNKVSDSFKALYPNLYPEIALNRKLDKLWPAFTRGGVQGAGAGLGFSAAGYGAKELYDSLIK